MSHINHRRGDSRGRSKDVNKRYWGAIGDWNRRASRRLRGVVAQTVKNLKAKGFEPEACEDVVFPQANEADDYWNYD